MGGAGECTTDTVTRAVMDEAVLQQAIMGVMKNDVFVQLIRDQVKEQVATAVAEAVASRDAEIESLREELSETKAQLNCLEQYSRRLCLDVSGIPETANEDTDRLIMDTARLAGVEIAKEDIDRSHRVGAVKPGNHAPSWSGSSRTPSARLSMAPGSSCAGPGRLTDQP